ncbi:MAG: glycosyltransferase family 39 protein [bacterium]
MILGNKFMRKVIEYKFLIFILIIGSFLLFFNLGTNRYLNGDSANEGLLAKSICSCGLPNHWDGKNIFADAYGNEFKRVGNYYILSHHPWLHLYVIAASYLLLGRTAFSTLFPGALVALFTIFLSYFFAIKISRDKEIAIITTLLLLLSVQFLLFGRGDRYYALIALFTLLMLYFYLKFLEDKKGSMIGFGISAILFFHSNYVPFIAVMGGIMTHFFLFEFKKERLKSILLSLLTISLFTTPWILFFHPSSSVIQSWSSLGAYNSIKEFLFVFTHTLLKINNHLFPFLLFVLVPFIMIKRTGHKLVVNNRYILILLVICFILLTFLLHDVGRSFNSMIPLFCLLSASIYKFIKGKNRIIAYVFLILLLFTNIINVTPTILFKSCISTNNFANIISFIIHGDKEKVLEKLKERDAEKKIEEYAKIKFLICDFLYEITHDYDNAIEGIIKYLQKYGKKDETVMIRCVEGLASNIIFYTGMKVIYKVSDNEVLFPPTEDFLKLNQMPPRGIDWYIKIPSEPLDYMPEGKYEKIIIDYPETVFDNYPFLPSHQFKTLNDGPKVVIYHKMND